MQVNRYFKSRMITAMMEKNTNRANNPVEERNQECVLREVMLESVTTVCL